MTIVERAAGYFGLTQREEPYTGFRTGRGTCVLVAHWGDEARLYVYDESWGQPGRITRLTEHKRRLLVNALEREGRL